MNHLPNNLLASITELNRYNYKSIIHFPFISRSISNIFVRGIRIDDYPIYVCDGCVNNIDLYFNIYDDSKELQLDGPINRCDPLHKAILRCNVEATEKILNHIDLTEINFSTYVRLAYDDQVIIDLLIKKWVERDNYDKSNGDDGDQLEELFMLLCEHDDVDLYNKICNNKIEFRLYSDDIMLHVGTYGAVNIFTKLTSKGIYDIDDFTTCMMRAIQFNHVDLIRKLDNYDIFIDENLLKYVNLMSNHYKKTLELVLELLPEDCDITSFLCDIFDNDDCFNFVVDTVKRLGRPYINWDDLMANACGDQAPPYVIQAVIDSGEVKACGRATCTYESLEEHM